MQNQLQNRLQNRLRNLEQQGLSRNLADISGCRDIFITVEGKRCLNLSSNDYLGMAADSGLHREFYQFMADDNRLDRYGLGSASSRLLTGNRPVYAELEDRLCALYGKSALVFNSGYHANIGILPALAEKRDLILADKFCHASLIDGMRLSRAKIVRYRHLDYEQLADVLESKRQDYENVFIVTESIFSMDGDLADLRQLITLKNQYDCLLYVDEAHAVGVFGRQGLGYAEQVGVLADVDILVGTFGKALASIGAFAICLAEVKEILINAMRSFIFTTALPPVNLAWSFFVLDKTVGMDRERERLFVLAERMRGAFADAGFQTRGESQIIPVFIGDTEKTVAVAAELRQHGFLLLPIRPPTVPAGTSRFRLSLSAGMNWDDLIRLPSLLRDLVDHGG